MSEEREAAVRGYEDPQAAVAGTTGAGAPPVLAGDPGAGAQAAGAGDPGAGAQPADAGASGAGAQAAGPGASGAGAQPGPGPMLLPPNPIFRFYSGGAGIDSFRGAEPGTGPGAPEDWVGSTTTSFGNDSEGLATLPDGRVLRDVIDADPVGFLGSAHVAELGSNPGLLVKLLDTGERLSVHFHPGREFARQHLHSEFGKTEAWLILQAEPGAHMHLGLREAIDDETVRTWIRDQDSEVMLRALNRVPVSAGDALFVPAGTLHTIGAGITLVELQEPSDMSVVIEWQNAGVSNGDEHLQLGWETVLAAADTSVAAPIHVPARPLEARRSTLKRLLPPEADGYFRAELLSLQPAQPLQLQPQFSILIGTAGELELTCHGHDPLNLGRGEAALIPHGAGSTTVAGGGTAIRCLPPSLREPSSNDPGVGAW